MKNNYSSRVHLSARDYLQRADAHRHLHNEGYQPTHILTMAEIRTDNPEDLIQKYVIALINKGIYDQRKDFDNAEISTRTADTLMSKLNSMPISRGDIEAKVLAEGKRLVDLAQEAVGKLTNPEPSNYHKLRSAEAIVDLYTEICDPQNSQKPNT